MKRSEKHSIGGLLGYALNFVQEHYYNTRVAKKGAEARLYGGESGSTRCGVIMLIDIY